MFNMMFFLYMFFMFFVLNTMSMLFYYNDLIIMFEWMIYSLNSMNLKFIMLFDWISLLFMSLIMFISSMIMLYSLIYMEGEKYMNRFNYLLIMFILSMVFMVISPNILSILLGWDGLGLVSYCLIMYYHNYLSYNSAMVTVLCNRIGDVGILMSIGLGMMVGNWDFITLKGGVIIVLMMMLAAITKSAQIPFSVWLPLAMAAPTPVSALVHSSTLVTAGIYLMIRFNKFLMDSWGVNKILFFIAVVTMFMSGLMANLENDFKKIIALSTLSQLGLMMMILSLGYVLMAFYHLLIHAIFKSMLFMAAGTVIHFMKNTQDIRLLGNLNEMFPYTMMSLVISNMALMGMPFMSGFYSKDFIMEIVYMESGVNMMMFMLIMLSLMLTVSYSVRFMYYLFFNNMIKFYSYMYIKENNLINLSVSLMMFLSIIVGSLMSWLYFFDYYEIYMSMSMKLVTLLLCMIGVVISVMMMILNKFIKLYYYFYFFSTMWYLVSLYSWIYKPMNLLSLNLYKFDKIWIEFFSKNYLLGFVKNNRVENFYKLNMFMFIFIYVSIYLYYM